MSPFLSFRNAVLVFAFLSIGAFALALSCHRPEPSPAVLQHAHDSTVHAVVHMDSVRAKVKVAHAVTSIRLKRLAPLRDRVTITPNGSATVDGDSVASVPGVRVMAKVIATQDTVIQALMNESAAKDTALVADSLALQASLHETVVARSFIPSKWQRVKTATKWSVAGGIAVYLLIHIGVIR